MKAKARPVDQWRLINFEKVLMTLVNSAPGQTEGSALTLLSDEIAKASQEEGFPIKPNTAAGVLQQLKRIRNKTTSFGGRWAATVECGIHRLIDAYGLSESYREPGFLDCPPEEKTLLAYVFASVDPKQWHGIYTTFKDIPEIKEASLIYGSSTVDAIIKIEAPTRKFNEVLIGTISDHPHIKTTQTLFAVSGSQWQKSQLERDAQLEDIPFYHSDAIQDDLTTPAVHADSLYPSPQIKRLFQKEEQNKQLDIEDMRHGDLVIKPEASINLFPEIVTESAQQSIRAVVILDKIGRGEKVRLHRYLQAQAMKKSHHPDFEIRRVFFFNDLEAQLKKAEICARLGYELAIGVQVKYLRAWCNVHQNDGPWDFGLMDETMQWIMENKTNYESIRHLRVSLNRTTVQRTARYFEIIWSNAEAFNSSQITPFHQAYLESDFVKWTPS